MTPASADAGLYYSVSMGECEQITLAILAGGRGSRMGRPKGLLEVRGKPILTYLLERLAWKGAKWLISAPGVEQPPGAEEFDREFVDPEAGEGPLRGVLTALNYLETPLLVVTTVDMPDVRAEAFEGLVAKLRGENGVLGSMYRRRSETEEIVEPFPLALRREALSVVRSRFQSGQRSVHRLLQSPGFVSVPAPDQWDVWTNLNNAEEFERWKRRL
jgi:molybdopterin-guanine dinucleotide biosynthesis protein A